MMWHEGLLLLIRPANPCQTNLCKGGTSVLVRKRPLYGLRKNSDERAGIGVKTCYSRDDR